jgi:hypothetical protein
MAKDEGRMAGGGDMYGTVDAKALEDHADKPGRIDKLFLVQLS